MDLSSIDIHAVTSALKLYLRELPIPLVTYEAYDLCVIATSELLWLLTLMFHVAMRQDVSQRMNVWRNFN